MLNLTLTLTFTYYSGPCDLRPPIQLAKYGLTFTYYHVTWNMYVLPINLSCEILTLTMLTWYLCKLCQILWIFALLPSLTFALNVGLLSKIFVWYIVIYLLPEMFTWKVWIYFILTWLTWIFNTYLAICLPGYFTITWLYAYLDISLLPGYMLTWIFNSRFFHWQNLVYLSLKHKKADIDIDHVVMHYERWFYEYRITYIQWKCKNNRLKMHE